MTLMEHLFELRNRLFKACLGVLLGLVICFYFADRILEFLNAPYCQYKAAHGQSGACGFNATSPIDIFLLNLRVSLYAGLIIAAPIWLYQVWAFIAPGLHRHERRYTYYFVGAATPLFFAGATLAYLVVEKGMVFLMGLASSYDIRLDIGGYFDFVTSMMLLFGFGFEFPLAVVALNLIGVVSAKRLFGWWRVAVFLCFLFAAVVTPTPDPFGMTALAVPMAALYFAAVGIAFLNDRRRARLEPDYGDISDDEASQLDLSTPETEDVTPVSPATPIDRRRDDTDDIT
jgi:sec-independent protein translocase protein TatC